MTLSSNPLQITYPQSLPIVEYKQVIIETIQKHQVVIIEGETGSGKTTQIPKMCLEGGRGVAGKIGCTQPRRVAAMSIAQRLAGELHSQVGELVGYTIRFSKKQTRHTTIQVMTDGILLAETQRDRYLRKYDTLIIDEAHERSLTIDFLLGYLKQLLPKRPDLKIIITSASIDTEKFSKAFHNAPIIEVSGRTYPVEIRYDPIDEKAKQSGNIAINDKVVDVVQHILDSTWSGDVLVFMPGERDIREVTGRLRPSDKHKTDILPLFGRLSMKEQGRIFQQISYRKVIVATNIAETSLTVPGIRYVVDAGLARISRYSARSQIQHLPIEPISQSSAVQRSGRAGRVESGICIRLYSEESFHDAPLYTEPEILRSNLGGVILQMLSLKLGAVEQFPFLDPPSSSAIKEGFALLRELGAVDEKNTLTALGREMARLPIEPKTARMLLEANKNRALEEVLVIAAGISIRDPREFPLEKEEQARQMHKVFVSDKSDFVTLLNIWNSYHKKFETLNSENKMRKFCKKQFLSYIRMREWRDIHQQLSIIIKESKHFRLNTHPADYKAIHLSILAGYLNHIAVKKESSPTYQSAGGKEAMIFPGSGVFKKGKDWIVAAEYMKTSRLFALMVAAIEPDWLEPIGGRLCRYHYSNPFYDEKSERVLVSERTTLYGLTIIPERKTAYGKVNPSDATAIFIREALLDEKLRGGKRFFENNNCLKRRLIRKGAKIRQNFEFEIESAMETYYTERLYNVFSIHDLNRLLKERHSNGEENFLCMEEQDFPSITTRHVSTEEFPDFWEIGKERLQLDYAFDTNPKTDGVTLHLDEEMIPYIDPSSIDWLVPGHWEGKIGFLLKGLPKSIRKKVIPLSRTSRLLSEKMKPGESGFLESLSTLLKDIYGIQISVDQWDLSRLPEYLQMNIEIRDRDNMIVASGRDAKKLLEDRKRRSSVSSAGPVEKEKPEVWAEAEQRWTMEDLQTWSFDDLPQKIKVTQSNTIPIYAYPGLELQASCVNRRLFHTRKEALQQTACAVRHLLVRDLGPDLAWLEKDLKDLKEFKSRYTPFGTLTELKDIIREAFYRHLFDGPWIHTKQEYDTRVTQGKRKLKGLWVEAKAHLERIFVSYGEVRAILKKYAMIHGNQESFREIQSHLSSLINKDFITNTPYSRWKDLPRYLRAIPIRLERMVLDMKKDQDKLNRLLPWGKKYRELSKQYGETEQAETVETLHWLIEEYRVSLFAPELKTAVPISEKRLEKFITKHINH